jgi:hypothetical protein
VATVAESDVARRAGLIQGRAGGLLLCVVDELEHARLNADDGIHTPASDALDKALDRRRAADAELERRLIEAEARARDQRRAYEAERERWRAEPPAYPRPYAPSVRRPLPAVR